MNVASRHALERELKHLTLRAKQEQQSGDDLALRMKEHHAAAEQARERATQIAADLGGDAANDDASAFSYAAAEAIEIAPPGPR